MSDSAARNSIALGDPVPWFDARTVTDGSFSLQVAAGRWIVLSFLGSLDEPRAKDELAGLLRGAHLFVDDQMIACGVLTAPPKDMGSLNQIGCPAVSFLADYDRELSRSYGALDMPRTIVLDPMLRAIADIPWDHPEGHLNVLSNLLRSLPGVDESAGAPINAPVLIVPRVFEFPFCDLLVRLYERMGGKESGFMLDVAGKSRTMTDHRLKRRNDLPLVAPELRQAVCDRLVRRLLPAVSRYFHFDASRIDRQIVACYDSAVGGHFYRHRDDINAGARHRRFAISLNLSGDYEGCDLLFPEFGRRSYRGPVGSAVVFSCGALHQVTPITRGRRYAFLAFLYGEADAALREINNGHLEDGEERYTGANDRLFPLRACG